MSRQSRIDAPGDLHHIITRGIGRRNIFNDDQDRDNFVDRLETVFEQTRTGCYVWALMSIHFHLLLRTGDVPVLGVNDFAEQVPLYIKNMQRSI